MKKLLILGIVGLFSMMAIAQTSSLNKKPLTRVQFSSNVDAPLTQKERSYIEEVYGDYAEKYIFSNPNRLKDFKNILRNRVLINEYPAKDLSSIQKLSTIPLLNNFNPSISRDPNISADNFNPLKYKFDFFSRNNDIKYYRVDNTQLLISILPQHN